MGSRVVIGNNDNSGAGFEVTAVNEATKVLTISPEIAGAPAVDTLITPWVPTGSESGTLIHGRLGIGHQRRGHPAPAKRRDHGAE